ncbi:MAG: ATP synthase F0 subunit B [Bacteroidetes bacterium RIFCSPLOWO2_12_FULL_31_6]|nr:MAG: ATP synthase F0 subunit B [Bacteroidetes bacterium RIFCSPLOWO2_12_FULL_31_6]
MDNPLVTPEIGMLFWTFLVFVILMLILTKYAWKPILNAVKEREASIEEALNAAKEAKLAMAELKSTNEDLLNQARAERDEMLKEARGIKDNIVANAKTIAKTEAEKIMITARESIQHEKIAAIAELKNQVAVLSIEIAEKILKSELSSADKQKTIIDTIVKDIHLN